MPRVLKRLRNVRTHTHTHTHTHTNTHTHTHTHTYSLSHTHTHPVAHAGRSRTPERCVGARAHTQTQTHTHKLSLTHTQGRMHEEVEHLRDALVRAGQELETLRRALKHAEEQSDTDKHALQRLQSLLQVSLYLCVCTNIQICSHSLWVFANMYILRIVFSVGFWQICILTHSNACTPTPAVPPAGTYIYIYVYLCTL